MIFFLQCFFFFFMLLAKTRLKKRSMLHVFHKKNIILCILLISFALYLSVWIIRNNYNKTNVVSGFIYYSWIGVNFIFIDELFRGFDNFCIIFFMICASLDTEVHCLPIPSNPRQLSLKCIIMLVQLSFHMNVSVRFITKVS